MFQILRREKNIRNGSGENCETRTTTSGTDCMRQDQIRKLCREFSEEFSTIEKTQTQQQCIYLGIRIEPGLLMLELDSSDLATEILELSRYPVKRVISDSFD